MQNETFHSLEEIIHKNDYLSKNSQYNANLDLEPFRFFQKLNPKNDSRSKIFPAAVPTLISGASDCSNCFYGLQLDTYMFGCTHDCIYCWAKTELTMVNQWNNPMPIPIDIVSLWDVLYTVFETQNYHPLRKLIEKRVPLRIGSMSDPFLGMETKYKITSQVLSLLKFYNYPVLILTRSKMASDDEYIALYDSHRVSIQYSIPSQNEEYIKILEPGTSSASERLKSLQKLMENKIWSSVRINPLFPCFKDGFLSNGNNYDQKEIKFNFFNLDLIESIAKHGCKSLLVGFAHMNENTIVEIKNKIGIDLKELMKDELKLKSKNLVYSSEEIRKYYELIHSECKKYNIEFSTCYLGLGDNLFYRDQDLWADKDDCCNVKKHVQQFNNTTSDISNLEKIRIISPHSGQLKQLSSSLLIDLKTYILKKIWNK